MFEIMNQLSKDDLAQIDHEYLSKRNKSDLIKLALRMRDQCIEYYERLNKDSSNSSKPPSSDNPYDKNGKHKDGESNKEEDSEDSQPDSKEPDKPKHDNQSDETKGDDNGPKRSPGKQPGAEGFWRSAKPEPDKIEPHHPKQCIVCGRGLIETASPYMGYYTYELEIETHQLKILCTLHHYYVSVCECGHENKEKPGEGFVSEIEHRKRNLKLTEYNMIGPMLTTYIAALSRRCGMSRSKIREYLLYWFKFELSVGSICRCIREAGIACYPVVDQLIDELQHEEKAHMDETPWYQKGKFKWLWVVVTSQVAVYYIGTRKKEELLKLITEAFFGWLITDGYGAYRSYEKRQRCLAHLIRKAIGLTGAVDKKARKMGDWLLKELRGLIEAMAQGEGGKKECRPILARLKKACNLGSKSDHAKLKSLAKEILNDWDAVVAFVKNPGLPATNNEAERALRWAVIFRKITFGTRSDEGSRSYAAMLSVIETCRLRNINPWQYISKVICCGRKGQAPPVMI